MTTVGRIIRLPQKTQTAPTVRTGENRLTVLDQVSGRMLKDTFDDISWRNNPLSIHIYDRVKGQDDRAIGLFNDNDIPLFDMHSPLFTLPERYEIEIFTPRGIKVDVNEFRSACHEMCADDIDSYLNAVDDTVYAPDERMIEVHFPLMSQCVANHMISEPVTVAQFRDFVEAAGYRPEGEGAGELMGLLSDRLNDGRPITWVNQADYTRYITWLSAVTGREFKLASRSEIIGSLKALNKTHVNEGAGIAETLSMFTFTMSGIEWQPESISSVKTTHSNADHSVRLKDAGFMLSEL